MVRARGRREGSNLLDKQFSACFFYLSNSLSQDAYTDGQEFGSFSAAYTVAARTEKKCLWLRLQQQQKGKMEQCSLIYQQVQQLWRGSMVTRLKTWMAATQPLFSPHRVTQCPSDQWQRWVFLVHVMKMGNWPSSLSRVGSTVQLPTNNPETQ